MKLEVLSALAVNAEEHAHTTSRSSSRVSGARGADLLASNCAASRPRFGLEDTTPLAWFCRTTLRMRKYVYGIKQ